MNAASHPLAKAQYVSFTTFRRNGDGVATPVWFAPMGDQFAFVSVAGTGKTKRLANDGRVTLRPCDMRGKVAPDAPTYTGTAIVDPTPGLPARFADLGSAAAKLVGRSIAPRAGIIVTLDEAN